jgi:ribosomal RNA-processing protein 12
MVGAGLTGTTPHMISASINALSRLVFEFKGERQTSLI